MRQHNCIKAVHYMDEAVAVVKQRKAERDAALTEYKAKKAVETVNNYNDE